MGSDLAASEPGVAAMFARADEVLGFPLSRVMGEGPLAAVVFSDQPVTDYRGVAEGDRARLSSVGVEMLKRGILVNLDVKFYLSLAHSEADVDAAVEAFEAGIIATAA